MKKTNKTNKTMKAKKQTSKRNNFSFYVSDDLLEPFKEKAKASHRSTSQYLRLLIERVVNEDK